MNRMFLPATVVAMLICSVLAAPLYAEPSVVGLWEQSDDQGRVQAWFNFSEKNGLYVGALAKTFPAPGEKYEEVCTRCPGDQKDAPFVGLVIVTQIVMKVALDAFFPPAVAAQSAEEAEAELAEEEEVPAQEREPANYLPLDPALVVNIQDEGKSQYLQASIQLMTRDTDVFEAAKLHAPAIRSALIMQFSTVPYSSLSTVEGKQALQDSARERCDENERELLDAAISNGSIDDLSPILSIIRETDSLNSAMDVAKTQAVEARQAIAVLSDSPWRTALKQLADYSVSRDH